MPSSVRPPPGAPPGSKRAPSASYAARALGSWLIDATWPPPLAAHGARTVLTKVAAYLERNAPYMDYATYLAQGWPIATGVIEGACRHLVKDRCELSGMRWTITGAEALLHLRCVHENGDWDAYHAFRRRQRHQRLYAVPYPDDAATPLDLHVLEPCADVPHPLAA